MGDDPMEPTTLDNEASAELILSLSGELDLAEAPDIRRRGLEALQAGTGDLVIDLAAVTFIDSSVIGALVAIRNEALAHERRVIVRSPQKNVRRVFELTGLSATFGVDAA
jgi:anti-sigma B factor antagonist